MTPSTMLVLGTPLPAFRLPDVDGTPVSSDQFQGGAGLLIVFLCPHCPYAKHMRREFARFAREYQQKGLPIVAINSNDSIAFPDDSREGMKKEISSTGYTFPYLVDESQSVAKAFQAACTPDFFLFDHRSRLVYRGQFDGSRPANQVPVTGGDLRAAADAVLEGRTPSTDQKASIGCNIKWKVGNEPDYFELQAKVK
jgi:peroxiredoxin